ncbi:MAG: hypothetical protein ACFFBL_08300, partial [Promethearchaeota archaeon]
MSRSPSRLLFIGFMALFVVIIIGSIASTNAQTFPDDFLHDDKLYVYISLDGMNVLDYDINNPLPLNMEAPMNLFLQLNATGTQTLNVSGTITFWYQGFALIPIQIVDAYQNKWFMVDPGTPIPPVNAPMDFSGMMSLGPIDLATGVFEATVDFRYYVEGDNTLHILQHQYAFLLPSTPVDVITSVTGIATAAATVTAVYGATMGINSLWDGLKTA